MQLPPILQTGSLTRLLQGAGGGAIATLLIGFYWGGWILSSANEKQVRGAEHTAIVRVLAPICADGFRRSPDFAVNLAVLLKVDSSNRNELLEQAGWTSFPGSKPSWDVASACVSLLIPVTTPRLPNISLTPTSARS
jgi:hypothetical protein